jgi:hypothetical protein
MLGQNHDRVDLQPPQPASSNVYSPASEQSPPTQRSDDRLARIACLVATGQIGVPLDLPDDELLAVVGLTREHSRQSLLRYIVRCIATDIIHSGDPKPGESDD